MKLIVTLAAFALLTGCATHGADMAHPKRIELNQLRACMSAGQSFTYCDDLVARAAQEEK